MTYTWLSLLPPLIVVGTVLLTKKLNLALFTGIISAALIATQGSLIESIQIVSQRTIEHITDIENLYLYMFLISVSSIVTLLTYTGSAAAYARFMHKHVRSKRSAETSSIILSFLLGIDDYLSILTVGSVMRPLVDRLAIARTRLAFLVHSLAGPVVILIPISSWAAAILIQLDQAGDKIAADSFYIYIKSIPFIFYSILIIFSVFFIVRKQISFGPIHHEKQTKQTNFEKTEFSQNDERHSLLELLLPFTLLLVGIIIGILITGNYHIFGGTHSFIDAFRYNTQTFLVMCIMGIISFVTSCLLALYKKTIDLKTIPLIIARGILLMYNAILMVVLASILSTFLHTDLMTGSYLAHILLGKVPILFLPVMIFFTSLLITLSTGSGWGTFALMIPIVIQMLISLLELTPPIDPSSIRILFPSLGAILSGAVCGDHVSPFSETTIMTATSTNTLPLEHARTQFPYAIPAIIGTTFSFIISGIMAEFSWQINAISSILVGMTIALSMLYMLNQNK